MYIIHKRRNGFNPFFDKKKLSLEVESSHDYHVYKNVVELKVL